MILHCWLKSVTYKKPPPPVTKISPRLNAKGHQPLFQNFHGQIKQQKGKRKRENKKKRKRKGVPFYAKADFKNSVKNILNCYLKYTLIVWKRRRTKHTSGPTNWMWFSTKSPDKINCLSVLSINRFITPKIKIYDFIFMTLSIKWKKS